MTQFVTGKAKEIAEAMGGKSVEVKMEQFGEHYDTGIYQTRHNVGGAIMGEHPRSSVVNRFLQAWDAHNVFVTGSSVFPQNIGYNPMGLAGALAYWSPRPFAQPIWKRPGRWCRLERGLFNVNTPERIALLSRLAASVITVAFVAMLFTTFSEAQAAPASQELVQRGAYLARAGDCIACHTDREGQPFAGGLPLNTPIGMIYSTNITPDLETGIGRYRMDDFVKVMREGVAKDGHRLYPAMQASAASAATRALRAGDTGMRGSRVYLDNCNACHRSDGSGANRIFPNLAKADVLSFIRGSWGNHAAAVSRDEVGRLRKTLAIRKTVR